MCLKIIFHAYECCRGRQVWIYLPFSQPNSHQQVGPSRWPLKSQKTLQLPGAWLQHRASKSIIWCLKQKQNLYGNTYSLSHQRAYIVPWAHPETWRVPEQPTTDLSLNMRRCFFTLRLLLILNSDGAFLGSILCSFHALRALLRTRSSFGYLFGLWCPRGPQEVPVASFLLNARAGCPFHTNLFWIPCPGGLLVASLFGPCLPLFSRMCNCSHLT